MNINISISYDGINFFGSQKQINKRTIQGEIEKSLYKVFNQDVKINMSGRTDKNVHAINQVANFNIKTKIPLKGIFFKLKRLLPKDIILNKLEESENNFHARFSAVTRSYVYKMKLRSKFDVFDRNYFYPTDKINLKKFNEVIQILRGINNYKFFSIRSEKENTIREVFEIKLYKTKYGYNFYIKANSFLRGMVRIIIHCCLKAYKENDSDYLLDKLKNIHKTDGKILAPPEALYLYEIEY